jgi:hypothetical protein
VKALAVLERQLFQLQAGHTLCLAFVSAYLLFVVLNIGKLKMLHTAAVSRCAVQQPLPGMPLLATPTRHLAPCMVCASADEAWQECWFCAATKSMAA